MPGFDAAGEAGLGRQFGDLGETELPSERTNCRLVHAGFDVGVHHRPLDAARRPGR